MARVTTFAEATWDEIDALRTRITNAPANSVADSAQGFASAFAETFSTVALVRVFMVVPFAKLPARDQAFALALVGNDPRVNPETLTLSLLGTRGVEAAFDARHLSRAHLAIPLVDRAFVASAPMIATLLAHLEVDLSALDQGKAIATRRMLGGENGRFYVPDALAAVDDTGRPIIPARDFVERHGVRTVFGMGGAYLDGTLAIAIVFTREQLDALVVDRYPSFIGTFKIATMRLQRENRIYA